MKYALILLLLSGCAVEPYEIGALYTGEEDGTWFRISRACAADLCAPETYR